jgi:hypothetical protein
MRTQVVPKRHWSYKNSKVKNQLTNVGREKDVYWVLHRVLTWLGIAFPFYEHLFEYIGTQFPPPSSLLYGKMGSITLFFFYKWA